MKRTLFYLLSIIAGLGLLASCASPPIDTDVQLRSPPSQSSDHMALERHVDRKLTGLSDEELVAVNEFIDQQVRAKYSGKSILIMGVEDNEWPFFLEGIMRSNIYLNSLPRDKARLIFRESVRTPGVVNVYYLVRANNIPKNGQHPLNWFSGEEVWNKYIDAQMNNLQDRSEKQAYLTLFTDVNEKENPELIIAVQGSDDAWDWRRMPHPKDTMTKEMLVPLLTIQNAGMAEQLK